MKKIKIVFIVCASFCLRVIAQQEDASVFYYKQADSLSNLNQFTDAIHFYTMAIQQSVGNTDIKLLSYCMRAATKEAIQDETGAYMDCVICINMENIKSWYIHPTVLLNTINTAKGTCYYLKAVIDFEKYHDITNACIGWSKALELGYKDALLKIHQYCNK